MRHVPGEGLQTMEGVEEGMGNWAVGMTYLGSVLHVKLTCTTCRTKMRVACIECPMAGYKSKKSERGEGYMAHQSLPHHL